MSRARTRSVALVTLAMVLFGARPASATITEPGYGATVRGVVRITESPGGSPSYSCGGGQTAISVYRYDGANVLWVGGGPGPYTTNWDTFGQLRGNYSIYGNELDSWSHWHSSGWSGYYHCHYSWRTLSSSYVILDNQSAIALSGPTSAYWNSDLFVGASLVDPNNADRGLEYRTVQVTVDGEPAGFAAGTNSGGYAQGSIRITQTPGTATVRARFDDDASWRGSSTLREITILARPTTLMVTGATETHAQDEVVVGARLLDGLNGAAIAGKTIAFEVVDPQGAIADTASGVTDGSGLASATINADFTGGDYTVRARFEGDGYRLGSGAQGALTIRARPTVLSYAGVTEVYALEDVAIGARLTDALTGAGVNDKEIAFELVDQDSGLAYTGSAVTNELGDASLHFPADHPAGNYTVLATFTDGLRFESATASSPLTILARPTALAYDGAVAGARGHTVTLSAHLSDETPGSARAGNLAGHPVRFVLGDFSVVDETDADGRASVDVLLNQRPDDYTVRVAFDGDETYAASEDSEAFRLGWEYVFTDALGRGTVNLNVITREFQFVAGDEQTAIKSDPMICGPVSLGCELGVVSIAYNDDEVTLTGWFDPATLRFSAIVRTASGARALHAV